tara:strand:+ start:984 stop:1544 length:561 start_codon:yes stop_codon:yes gene_type:complete
MANIQYEVLRSYIREVYENGRTDKSNQVIQVLSTSSSVFSNCLSSPSMLQLMYAACYVSDETVLYAMNKPPYHLPVFSYFTTEKEKDPFQPNAFSICGSCLKNMSEEFDPGGQGLYAIPSLSLNNMQTARFEKAIRCSEFVLSCANDRHNAHRERKKCPLVLYMRLLEETVSDFTYELSRLKMASP